MRKISDAWDAGAKRFIRRHEARKKSGIGGETDVRAKSSPAVVRGPCCASASDRYAWQTSTHSAPTRAAILSGAMRTALWGAPAAGTTSSNALSEMSQ